VDQRETRTPSTAFTGGSATADAKADVVHLVETQEPIVAPGGKLPSSDAPSVAASGAPPAMEESASSADPPEPPKPPEPLAPAPALPPFPLPALPEVDVEDVGVEDVVLLDVVEVDVGVPAAPEVGMPAVPAALPGTSLQAVSAAVAQNKPHVNCARKVSIGATS